MPEHAPHPDPSPPGDRPGLAAARASAVIVGLYALVAAAILIAGVNRGRYAWDAVIYHEPAIVLMSRDLPIPDVSNYFSATTPGYHYLMACVRALGVESLLGLRAVSACITGVFFGLLAGAAARRTGALAAVALCLPLLGSMYTLMPGVFLLPDNLGYLLIAALLLAMLPPSPTARRLALAGALVALATLVKQIHVWSAAVVWAGAWAGAAGGLAPTKGRVKRAALALLVTAPAFVVVAWFYRLWGGLCPPRFQGGITGVNPSLPAFMLVQIAVLAPFYALPILGSLTRAARAHPRAIAAAALAGLALALIPPTTHDPDAGRYSGYWKLAEVTPVLLGRTSSAFVVLAPVGAAALAAWGLALPARARAVLGVSLLAFAAAHAATINAWQRYHEPMLLILFVLATAEIWRARARPAPAWRLAGPALAAALLGAFTVATLLTGPRVTPGPLPPEQRAPGDPEPPYGAAPIRPIDEQALARGRTVATPPPETTKNREVTP